MSGGKVKPCRLCGSEKINESRIKKQDWICNSCHKKKYPPSFEEKKRERLNYRKTERSRFTRNIHKKVARAIVAGKLIRLPCEICHDPNSEAHHEDYTKPLEVQWLCGDHHREHHLKPQNLRHVT